VCVCIPVFVFSSSEVSTVPGTGRAKREYFWGPFSSLLNE
jgi:hypothetical protein